MLAAIMLALSASITNPTGENWSVNLNNTLIWAGRPYMPIGARVHGDQESIDEALKAGIKDLIIELPANGAGWDEAILQVENANARWFLSLSSTAPGAIGTVIEPGSYRIDLDGPLVVDVNLPGASEVLGVVADKRNADIRTTKSYLTPNGNFKQTIDPGISTAHVLLIYPTVRDLTVPDFWEGFDNHRDEFLRTLSSHKMGSGFRGIIDPLGSVAKFPTPNTMFVPRSALFGLEMQAFLLEKYGTVDTCVRAWSIGAHDITTWEQLSRLVPLWSVSKGVESLWDPVADRLYPSDRNRSSVWLDIRLVIRSAAQRRYSKLVQSIQQATGAPVIQTWDGWNGAYDNQMSGLAGIACNVSARTITDLIESTSRPASTVLQAPNGQVLIASNIKIPTGATLDRESAIAELKGIGARAWFFEANEPSELLQIAALAANPPIDDGDADWKPQALFYPEGARNPALPSRLFGGTWMLPSPAAGNRLDLGSSLSGYYYSGNSREYTVIWASGAPIETRLFLGDPKSVRVEALDGSDVRIRVRKDSIELEITQVPLVFTGIRDIPIPDASYQETVFLMTALFSNFGTIVDPGGDQQFLFAQSTQAFKRNPIGGYSALRKQFDTLASRAAPYIWIEAERATQSNFGDVDLVPGASGGNCLVLNSRMRSKSDYSATYNFKPRLAGKYEFWVAAAVPASAREHLTLLVNGKTLTSTEPPVSAYGLGFAWYKFESTELKGETKLSVHLSPNAQTNVAVDVIVASPSPFQPRGGQMPLDFIAPPTTNS